MNVPNISFGFRDPAGPLYHGGAVIYALGAWTFGLAGLFAGSWLVNAAATLLLAHGMIIAAYLIHECAHNTVFRDPKHNEILGEILGWFAGSAYGTFDDIRFKHLRHHVDNDDLVWFDYAQFFERHPVLFRTVKILEWFYIPAHDLVMYTIMMFTSFYIPQRRDQRRRNVTVLVVRGGLFLAIALASIKAAVLWSIACLLRIHVLRFTDMLQHDYSFNTILFDPTPSPTRGDREYEQMHTFSNPISLKFEPINWLTLNFGFHNAHHARPTTPWFRLPALHRELFGDDPARVIPFRAQLDIYHRHRIRRILEEGELPGGKAPQGKGYLEAARTGRAYGGNAASFLTSF